MTQGTPPQSQSQPGRQDEMRPEPRTAGRERRGSGQLDGRTTIVTGGDSGIGRSVSVLFAREGADVTVVYLEEHDDAGETARMVAPGTIWGRSPSSTSCTSPSCCSSSVC